MLILLSGPIGAGKTTLCERAAAAARERGLRVAGVLAPAIVEDGAKVGIEAVDLASGKRRLLARTDRELGGMAVTIHYDGTSAWAEDAAGRLLPAVRLYWFAWVGFHPETRVFTATD